MNFGEFLLGLIAIAAIYTLIDKYMKCNKKD